MTTQASWTEVDPKLRERYKRFNDWGPMLDRLLADKTVFIIAPEINRAASAVRIRLRNAGIAAHVRQRKTQHNGREGYYVWLERK